MCILSFLLDPNQLHLMPAARRKPYLDASFLALNAAFTQQLSLEDEGYESGSNEDVLTPLRKMPHIHHMSSLEHASFNPIHSTPCRPVTCNPTHSPARSVRCHLSFQQ